METKVKKRDGQIEPFDRNKIKNGLVKSGATPEQAEQVTAAIEAWAPSAAADGVIDAIAIKTKLLELLRVANPQAAATFEAYRKPAEEAPAEETPAQEPPAQPA